MKDIHLKLVFTKLFNEGNYWTMWNWLISTAVSLLLCEMLEYYAIFFI